MSVYSILMGSASGARFASPYVASKRRTMMFIGDSITWGYGVSQWQAYPALLQTRFDTQSSPAGSTDKWVARSVHADDIFLQREVAPNVIAFKLAERDGVGSSITYDNAGPFSSSFASGVIDPPNGRTAILFNSFEDSFFVTPTSPTIFITLIVKVTGAAGSTITIGVQDGTATINLVEILGQGALSPGLYRLIFAQSGLTTPTSTFLVRCTATGGATARILTVNPTNSYPGSNYVAAQITARGSYTPEDYSATVSSILETIIHPADEAGNPNTHSIFVLALGTVSIYYNVPRTAVTINLATDQITWTGHNLTTAAAIRFSTTGSLPTGLVAGTTYYAIIVDADTIRVATSSDNASAGTFVDLTGTQSGVHTGEAVADRRSTPETFKTNLSALAAGLRAALPSAPIVLTHPPIPNAPWAPLSGYSRSQYDAMIQSVALQYQLPVVDLRMAVSSANYLDGLHPNAAGHTAIRNAYVTQLNL